MAFVRTYGIFRTSGTVTTATLGSVTFTTGNLAVIVIWWYNTMTDAITVSDSGPGGGGGWTKVPGTFKINPNTGTPNLGAQIWTKQIGTGGTGITITATFPSNAFFPAIGGIEFSGRDTTNPIDVAVSATGLGVAGSGPGTTSTPGCDLFGAVYDDSGTESGQGSGWSFGSILFTNYLTEYQQNVAIGSYSATSNSGSSVQYSAQMVALKSSSPPLVTGKPPVWSMVE